MINVIGTYRRALKLARRVFSDASIFKKKYVGYLSFMSFKDQLTSGFQEVCDLFASFTERRVIRGYR
jgi:hypothetical protein